MKAIFWDFDGVLINSMEAHAISWQKSLGKFNINVSITDIKELGGMQYKEIINLFANKISMQINDDIIEKIYSTKLEFYKELSQTIKPFDILENLVKLKNQNVKMFIVTGSIRARAMDEINKYFKGIFETIVSDEDTVNGKPNPEPYLKAWEMSSLPKDKCYVVEDGPLGVKSGKAAGLKVLSLTTTVSKEKLNEADEIFETHNDLFKFFESVI